MIKSFCDRCHKEVKNTYYVKIAYCLLNNDAVFDVCVSCLKEILRGVTPPLIENLPCEVKP